MAGGFLVHRGTIGLLPLLIAALPLNTLGSWQFFALGTALRAHALKPPDSRILPPSRIGRLDHLLAHKGARIVFYGRLAAFPAIFLAAAAGASKMSFRRLVAYDALGAAFSFIELVSAGYLLGKTYEKAGVGLTMAGAVVFVIALAAFGRRLARDEPESDPAGSQSPVCE